MNKKNPKEAEKIVKILEGRFKEKSSDIRFKALGERFEEIREKAERGLISSVEFIKQLCELAKDTLRVERDVISEQEKKSAKSALTELFLEMKTPQTPAVVERIVNDIDAIVKLVRYEGWQTSSRGEREVQKALRKSLYKYKLHKDQTLFDKAYNYIKEYY